jgi:hypothetical protein
MEEYEDKTALRAAAEKRRNDELNARVEELATYWRSKLLIGHRIIEKVSGMTGEIYKIQNWGVQVWVPMLGNEKQNWTWAMLATRFPRKIKRYPRPFRFPREVPTECCHCKMGRMEVEGENQVRCTRCKFLIGDESFPRRIKRATSFLKKKYAQPRGRRSLRPRVDRSKHKKTSYPRNTRHQTLRKAKGRVGVRTRGRKEKGINGKIKRNPAIPTTQGTNAVPEARGTDAISTTRGKEISQEGKEVAKVATISSE